MKKAKWGIRVYEIIVLLAKYLILPLATAILILCCTDWWQWQQDAILAIAIFLLAFCISIVLVGFLEKKMPIWSKKRNERKLAEEREKILLGLSDEEKMLLWDLFRGEITLAGYGYSNSAKFRKLGILLVSKNIDWELKAMKCWLSDWAYDYFHKHPEYFPTSEEEQA